MANRKKQEDKHLKILRELVGQQNNKKCFDCGQRGPTYVNMTIGVFVCTSCSGLLRGLNPPHRIKSISMATFSAAEIEFLQNHGNEVCRNTWLALWNSPHPPEPESREEQKVKDFLIKKYERKMWFSNQPKPKNIPQSVPEAKPLKQLVGENSQEIQVNVSAPPVSASFSRQQTVQFERKQSQPFAQPPSKPKVDLLADLGGDPFGSTHNQQSQSQSFASFDTQPQQQDIFGQSQHPFGDSSFANQQSNIKPPFGGQRTPFASQPKQTPFGNTSQSSSFSNQQPSSSNQSSLINTNDPFGAVTPPASSSMSFNAFASNASNAQPASNGSFSFFESTSNQANVNALSQPAAQQGLTQSELDRYKALSELDDVFRGSNTQSVFSSTTSASSNAMDRTANQQPNPFMSPATGTSGIAMFQQQQQKAPNPFQSGSHSQNQPTSWGMMPSNQNQGIQSSNMQRNQQQFGQSTFGSNQQTFAASQAGYANNQANMGNQMAFTNQMKFPADKMTQQGQMSGAQQGQQQFFNAQQQQMFNGQQQSFHGQQSVHGQQFGGGQQGFGSQQMPGFQNQIQGQMSGQMQGQMAGQMPGEMSGQMPGQMSGQMSSQMQGQMAGQMQSQMPGGFGNQQQQHFGTWGQTGVGAFGMGGLQSGMTQKSTNPFM